ncbi:MAG: hypothetical protein EOP58_14440, partial [Sphingomonadales bacterium]
MALAKLCACACGGAMIGGGGVYVTERVSKPRVVHQQTVAKKRVVRRVVRRSVPAKRVVRRTVTTTTSQGAAQVIMTPQGAPIPLPPPLYG